MAEWPVRGLSPWDEELKAYIDTTIGQSVNGLNFRTDPAGDTIVSRLDNRSGVAKIVNYTDSTGTNPYRWPRLSATAIATRWPDTYLGFHEWDYEAAGSEHYNAREVVNNAPGFVPGTGGGGITTIVSDNFNRTAADAVGTTPQTGSAWAGTAGRFSIDGTRLVVNTPGYVASYGSGSPTTMTTTATGVRFSTTSPTGAARTLEIGTKAIDASNYVAVSLNCNVGGAVTWSLWKRIGGTPTQIGTGGALGLTPDAVNTLTISIAVDGTSVTGTINNVTVTGSLSGSDVTALAAGNGAVIWPKNAPSAGITVDSISATAGTSGTPDSGHGLLFYNACRPGGTLDYHTTHLNAMTPTDTRVAIINMGHNYGVRTALDFLGEMEAFIALVKARAPGVRIIVSSQNPQFTPRSSAQIEAHASRNTALRVWAHENGYGYIPGLEAFTVRADRGQSLVNPDGVHPDSSLQKPDNGNRAWAAAFLAYLEAHSMMPRYVDTAS